MEGNAPGHPLGFDGYRQIGPIEVVGVGGGGDDLPNIYVIAVGNDAATECLDDDSASRFSGKCFSSLITDSNQSG